MKKFITYLLIASAIFLSCFSALAQSGAQQASVLRMRLTDTTQLVTPAGYALLYYNNATSKLMLCDPGGINCREVGSGGGGGSGSVTNVSSGNLSPLFNVNVTNPTTTPTFSFSAISQSAGLSYMSPAGAPGAPTFRAIAASDVESILAPYRTTRNRLEPDIRTTSFNLALADTSSMLILDNVADLIITLDDFSAFDHGSWFTFYRKSGTDTVYFDAGGESLEALSLGLGEASYAYLYYNPTDNEFYLSAGSATGGTGGSQDLQSVLTIGSTASIAGAGVDITADNFIFTTQSGGSIFLIADFQLNLSSGGATSTWPSSYPVSNGYVLSSLTDGTLSWVPQSAGDITVGTTTIISGTNTRVLYNNSGVVGEYTVSGSGNVAMTTNAVLTTPDLGIPSAVDLTNGINLPISTGVSGLGTGVAAALAINTGSVGAFVLFNGAGGAPSSITLTSGTGLPLSTGVVGRLPFSNLTQISGLSILGVTGSSMSDVAGITATNDHEVVRRSGSNVAFGSINLASSNTVGSSILPVANGGTGISSLGTGVATFLGTPSWTNFNSMITGTAPYWALTGTSTLTGNVTIAGGTNTFTFTGSSASSSTDVMTFSGGGIAASSGTNYLYRGIVATPTYNMTGTVTSSNIRWLDYNPTATSITGTTHYAATFRLGTIVIGSSASISSNQYSLDIDAAAYSGNAIRISQNATGGAVGIMFGRSSTDIAAITATGSSAGIPNALYMRTALAGGNMAFATAANVLAGGITSGQKWYLGGSFTPNSYLDVNKSVGFNLTSVSATTTASDQHYTILVDASGGASTIDLPAASGATRRIYVIKKIDASVNSVTVDGNSSETIDGATTYVMSAQWKYVTIQCDGTQWLITSNN